jgi:hypothetical protein
MFPESRVEHWVGEWVGMRQLRNRTHVPDHCSQVTLADDEIKVMETPAYIRRAG